MTKETVNFVLQQVQQYKIPEGHRATPHAQKLYEEGLDIVESWRGNPHVINQALVAFCETNSRAYASAGIAFALSSAAYISDGKFDPYGTEKALEWLEDAQNIDSERGEINVMEAIFYFRLERYNDARKVLDEVKRRYGSNYWICRLEISFAEKDKDLKALQRWYDQTKQNSANESQGNNALKAMADALLKCRAYDKALKAYQALGQRTPKDAWLWNNLSIVYLEMGDFKQAEANNTRALQLMDFVAARQVQQRIRALKRSNTGWLQGLMAKFFGRSPKD